jgi:hypothetical protein
MSAGPDRKERPEYVSLHPSDWLGGCSTLPPMAEWLYWQISLYCMDKGEPVPANRLPMILVRYGGDWQPDLDLLIDLGKVHRTASGAVFVKRSLIEYERADAALKKKRRAGKAGAEKRWNANGLDSTAIENDSSANGDAIENRCGTNSSRAEQSREDHPLRGDAQARGPAQAGAGGPARAREDDLLFHVDEDAWATFAEHRVKLRAPLTERAATLIRNELIKIREEHGHDPTSVLRQSVMRGWKGVFPLKGDDSDKRSGWRFDHEQ